MKTSSIDLAAYIRPEAHWNDEQLQAFAAFWHAYYRREDISGTSVQRFKVLLGRQTLTVQLRHRCWVWVFEKAALFVDRRGPAFHTLEGLSVEESYQEFVNFTHRVERAQAVQVAADSRTPGT